MLPLTKINRNSLTFCPPHPGLIEIVFDLSARGRLETVYLLSLHSFPEGTRNSLRGKQDSCFLYSKDSSVSCCCFKELGSQVAQVGLELAIWLRMMNFWSSYPHLLLNTEIVGMCHHVQPVLCCRSDLGLHACSEPTPTLM